MPLEHEEVDHSAVRGGKNEFLLSSEATLDLHCPNKKMFKQTVGNYLKRRGPDPYCGCTGGHEGERWISWVRNNWFWQKEKQGIALYRWPRPLRTAWTTSSVGGEVRRMTEPWQKGRGDEQRKISSCLKLSPSASVQEGSYPLWHSWHSPAAAVQLPPPSSLALPILRPAGAVRAQDFRIAEVKLVHPDLPRTPWLKSPGTGAKMWSF